MSEHASPSAQRPAPERFTAIVDPRTLRIERDLPGPIDRVWAYLTKGELRATWMSDTEIPAEVGAEFSSTWEGEDGEPGGRVDFRVRVYDAPHVLEYSWGELDAPSGAVRDSIVRFELRERGDRVHLTLIHSALPDTDDARTSFGAGWHAHVDVLEAVLSGVDGPDVNTRFAELEPLYVERAGVTPAP
jgi:uncharacterized protein YndB with AHSA1/START domain